MGKFITLFRKQEIPTPAAIPLDRGVLCMNCETIYEVTEKTCPKCGSHVSMNIGLALGDEATKLRVADLSGLCLVPGGLVPVPYPEVVS